MISDVFARLGMSDLMSPILVGNGWLVLGTLNIALAWATSVLYRRRKKLGQRQPQYETAVLYGLCFMLILVALLTMMMVIENRSWDATALWLLFTWTTLVVGRQGFSKRPS